MLSTIEESAGPTPIRSALLEGTAHGFFGRQGGVSTGIYRGLNCGAGSNDDPQAVATNRARAVAALGFSNRPIATPYQVHGREVAVVDEAWGPRQGPKVDGVVTKRPGVIIGVLSADCAPILFADPGARVIGAAHAGWRGALAGVTDAVLDQMCALGATRPMIRAVIGPCIGPSAYEVGLEFEATFLSQDTTSAAFFSPGAKADKRQFDLPGYVAHRLRASGLEQVENSGLCTYSAPELFFSFRRTTHNQEPDYGRDLSAIALHD
jgi:YfiH family protein